MREKLIEDLKFIRGEGRYVDDLRLEDMLWLGVVRSQYARAKIKSIDTSEAGEKTLLAITSDDIKGVFNNSISGLINPEANTAKLPVLADGVANFVGQPLLGFVSKSRYALEDLEELFSVDYEPLEPVLDPEKAMESSSEIIHPSLGTNVNYSAILGTKNTDASIESAFSSSENIVVEDKLSTHRVVPNPIETRGVVVNWDGSRFTISVSSQGVFNIREAFKDALKMQDKDLHIMQTDTGGAFGAKSALYPEYVLACYASMKLGKPVKWIETRKEHFVGTQHGRDARAKISIAAKKNTGEIVALKGNVIGDIGAYAFSVSSRYAAFVGAQLTGPYRIPHASVGIANVYTNKTPLGPYRGAGRPEAAFFYERMMDLLADELRMDEVELRRRNLIRLEEMPFTSPTGMLLDSENYSAILDKSLAFFNYNVLRASLAQGSGVGLTDYIELSRSTPGESALIKLERDGSFTVFSGLGGQGQGHVTMLRNLLSGELGVPKEKIHVVFGDSDLLRGGIGTFGSRSAVAGGNAVIRAAQELEKKIVDAAALKLGQDKDQYYYSNGSIKKRDDPSFKMNLEELASKLNGPPLLAAGFYEIKDTSSFGVHAAVVKVDAETGKVKILKYLAGDDSGKIIDETSAEAQIAGGVMQGIGEVFYEEMLYNESGQPVVATFADDPIPEATESVIPKSILFEFPSSLIHGVRGIGEAGAIAAPPTLVRAVEVALRKSGKRVRIRSTLLKPEEVLKLIS